MSNDKEKDNGIRYVEIVDAGTPHHPEPTMPTACGTGGCGCGSGASEPFPVLSFGTVRVNGVEIREDDIAREMQHHRAESAEAAWKAAAQALVIKTLLLQEANLLGIESQPEQAGDEPEQSGSESRIDSRVENLDDALVRTLLERQLPQARVHDEECRRYYDTQTHRFRTPDLFEAAHILIEPSEDSDSGWQQAEQTARALTAELVSGSEQQFAEAAQKYSGCPTAQQGGSLGQIRRGELDRALHAVLETLTEGRVAHEPVRSRFGWHLIRLHRRIIGRTLPFDMVREKIVDMLEARAWVNAASHYIAELAGRGNIEGVRIDPQSANLQSIPPELLK